MTDKDKLDRAIREAELARSDYFDGKVGDADYILRVLSLFTDVAGDGVVRTSGGVVFDADTYVAMLANGDVHTAAARLNGCLA